MVSEQVESYLEVEDAGVFMVEALTVRNHAMQQPFVQSQRANSSEEPAVTWNTSTGDRENLHPKVQLQGQRAQSTS